MLTSPCSSSSSLFLFHRPSSKFRVPRRVLVSSPLTLTVSPFKSTKKWKIQCFRKEDSAPENPDQFVPEELVKKPDQDCPIRSINNDSNTTFQKSAYAVLKAIGTRWKVPWTAETIVQVMLLRVAAFWFIGSDDPIHGSYLRSPQRLSHIQRPSFVQSRHRRHRRTSRDCYPPPLPLHVPSTCNRLVPLYPQRKLASVEQSIMARDPVAMALYAFVVSVCAPVWEEIVFRGFLLPSLTRYMPVWCAVLVSSVAFALAHFNVERLLPLVFLGVVLGLIFARSRNLLPSMLLHSLWNGFVFMELMHDDDDDDD